MKVRNPQIFFAKTAQILKQAPSPLRDEILRHIDYLADKVQCSREYLLSGGNLNIESILIYDAIKNISSVIGSDDIRKSLFRSSCYEQTIKEYIELLQPFSAPDCTLKRFGNKNDGGYILLDAISPAANPLPELRDWE